MKTNLPKETIEEIRNWNGFQNFDGKNIEYNSQDEDIFEGYEVSVLMEAIRRGEIEIVENLCKAGANVNRIVKETHQTPLICFDDESENSTEIAKILIDYGANVNYLSQFDLDDDLSYIFQVL
jgi:Ankyrin repeat.